MPLNHYVTLGHSSLRVSPFCLGAMTFGEEWDSLLQRTVEGELIPMARELGLGVTPWSPLARGVLSGKSRARTRQTPARSW
jgi:aryl-alcohol dehydrogenase-like predicted oxidoreductase